MIWSEHENATNANFILKVKCGLKNHFSNTQFLLTFENMWPCRQFQKQKLQTSMFQVAIVLT